jgi:Zn-dependent metalloprotease
MCQQHSTRNPIHCIIPPYISEKLVNKAPEYRLPVVLNNKLRNSRFRNDRNFFGNLSNKQRSILSAVGAPAPQPVLKMQVFDLKNSTVFTKGKLVWDSEKTIQKLDYDAKNVIRGGRATWSLYCNIFGRNSIDGCGMPIRQYIHYDSKYENAFWDGRRMIFGDGDGKVFGTFTADADIVGHELAHGVTQYEANFDYHNQSGALNESVSDVFGIMIKQRLMNQDVKTSNWLIGEKVLKGKNYALRSIKEPGSAFVNHPEIGTDPQPATMNKYVTLPDTEDGDWGGVHVNSGIPNFAFYVAAFNIGGNSWEKIGKIWYAALTDGSLKTDANFIDYKNLTIKKATELFGSGSLELRAVKVGWKSAKL